MFGNTGHCDVLIFVSIRRPVYELIHSTGSSYAACENLSKYYPIAMRFSGYLSFYEDTSAVDFETNQKDLILSSKSLIFL